MTAHDPPLLFDLGKDPSEQFDRSLDFPDVIESILARVDTHFASVGQWRLPAFEAEALIGDAPVSGGQVRIQQMRDFGSGWGGGAQLWWVEAQPGDVLTIPIQVEVASTYELVGFFTRAQDYGIVRVRLNEEPVGSLVDCFNDRVEPTGPVSFGPAELKAGKNVLSIELIGKDSRSSGYSGGYLVGFDGFSLHPHPN